MKSNTVVTDKKTIITAVILAAIIFFSGWFIENYSSKCKCNCNGCRQAARPFAITNFQSPTIEKDDDQASGDAEGGNSSFSLQIKNPLLGCVF